MAGSRRRRGRRFRSLPSRSLLGANRYFCENLEQRLLMAVTALYPGVTLDPLDRLATSRILGDWNAATSDGWQFTNVAAWTVAGGNLTITSQNATANPAQIDLRAIAAGPYLDFGYFDYLQLRMQLPLNFNQDLTFSFGTNTRTGFAADRTFTVAADQLFKDGQFHTYRLDLGLVIWWRDTLTDLRIQPLGTTGANETVTIDYVEVGDLPGDVLGVNTNLNLRADSGGTVTLASAQKLESKHFVVWWDPAVNPNPTIPFNHATHGRNALRMLEESYQVYYKVLTYKEPFNDMNGAGARLKLNLLTWYDGYWAGGWANRAHMNIGTGGLQDEGWGSPVPHEVAHAFDMHQGAALAGGHWESHANYMREARTTWFAPLFPAGSQSTVPLNPLVWSNFRQDQQRMIYEDYRIHTALESHAEEMGLPFDTAARLWKLGEANKSAWEKLALLLPGGTSIKDVAAGLLRHWPMLDFDAKTYIRGLLWTTTSEKAEYEYKTGSPLFPATDLGANWFRVPFERAPEKYAYMFHELVPVPGATSITATVRGLALLLGQEDWRWSFIAIDAAGNPRYSPAYAPGTQAFPINPGENRILLFVTATPNNPVLDLTSFYNTRPNDKNAERLRYPYEVQLLNATPLTKPLNWTLGAGGYRTNPDGSPGGWVASSATVSSTAYIGPNARVLGTAQVLNNARIEDYAVVAENARVRDSAVVSGYAVIYDNGIVENNARIRDHAMVTQNARVQGNALLEDYARLGDSVTLRDWAVARGNAYLWGSAILSGYAIADYDYSMNYTLSDGVHMNHIPFDDYFNSYYAQTQKKPRGLVASYRVEETVGDVLWDEFGTQHAWLKGSPGRISDAAMKSNVLSFNGSSQYAVLDRSVADLTDGAFALWVNPASADTDETLLYFGASANTFLKLTARDANGFARLTLSYNDAVSELVATTATPLNAWTHIALNFGAGLARFYINGVAAGSLATPRRPFQFLGANDYRSPTHFYLARDAAGNYFTGRLEDIRFYNASLSQAEVQNEMARGGNRIGQFFSTAIMDFNGSSTTFESGVRAGATRTLSVWINPRANAAVYSAIFDAYNERGAGNNRGNGFGLQNGNLYLRLDGVGLVNTGVAITLNAWQQVAVTFSGTSAQVYLNGTLRFTRSYSNLTQAKNYHIGFYQADTATPPARAGFFNGQMYDARIFDSVAAPTGKLDTPPIATNDSASVPGGTPSTLLVLANDSDPHPIVSLKVASVTQPAHGTVSIHPNATAITYTPLSGYAGADAFTYTITDGFGSTATATVNLTVVFTLSSIVVTPPDPALANGASITLSAAGLDQVGVPISPQPAFSWSIERGAGTLTPAGGNNASATFTSGNNTEPVIIKVGSGDVSTTFTINVTSSLAPVFTVPPAARINSSGTSGRITGIAVDPADPAAQITYSYALLGTPPAPVTFSPNNSPGAGETTVSFTKAGAYDIRVRATGPSGHYTDAIVQMVVAQHLASIAVSSPSPTVAANATTQFSALARDQFGEAFTTPLAFSWSVLSGGGFISSAGLFTAPPTAGISTVRALLGGTSGQATVSVAFEEVAWYKADNAANTLTDSSGNNRTAFLTGTLNTQYTFPAGIAGNALRFVSGAPYASLPAGIMSGITDFTIATWVKIDTLSTWSRIFDFGTGTTTNMFLTPAAGVSGSPLRFAITTSGGGGEQQLNGPALSANTWYHIAVTLSGSAGTLYVNGLPVAASNTFTLRPADLGNTTLNYLGKSQYNDPAFLGSIDDFRIFARGLSATEVLALAAPTILAGPAPAVSPVSTTAGLSVIATDITAGEPSLTYTWSVVGTPPAPVSFSANGTNAAKNTLATFTKPGTYNFQVAIVNLAAGRVTTAATSVVVSNAITGRYLFYNNSSFDGNNPAATLADNAAIATDKSALLGGQTANFSHYSSYSKGINGIMIDVARVANPAALSAADFLFSMGASGDWFSWTLAPAPTSISVRVGGGLNGADRIVITWADGAILNTWLRVWINASPATGLAAPDTFFFGNQVGETGNLPGNTAVDAADAALIDANAGGPVPITTAYDINRDGMVNDLDASALAGHPGSLLALITPPGPALILTLAVEGRETPLVPPHGPAVPDASPGILSDTLPAPLPPLPATASHPLHTPAPPSPGASAARRWKLWQLPQLLLQRLAPAEDAPAATRKRPAEIRLPATPKPLPVTASPKAPARLR